jgi:hypothetical protein
LWTEIPVCPKSRGEERGRYILETLSGDLIVKNRLSVYKVSSTGLTRDLMVKIRSSGYRFQIRGRLGYITAIHVKDKEHMDPTCIRS